MKIDPTHATFNPTEVEMANLRCRIKDLERMVADASWLLAFVHDQGKTPVGQKLPDFPHSDPNKWSRDVKEAMVLHAIAVMEAARKG